MELYDDSVAVARLLNRICIPQKQDPFFMELLWFRKQFITDNRMRAISVEEVAAFRRAAHAERLTEDGKKTNSQRSEK